MARWDYIDLVRIAVAGVLVVCTIGLAAQQPQVPGAFRSRITMVPVDVRVVDREGRPITDLTRADFQVFEDGRPQDIATFDHVLFAAEPIDPAETLDRPALRRAPGPDATPQSGRVFLFVLGRGRLQYPTKILDALVDFLDTKLLPQDHAAVIAYNRATDFTRDHKKLKRVIEAFRAKHERIESKMTSRQSGLAAIYGSKEVPAKLQPDVDAIFAADGAPGFREMPPGRASEAARVEQDMRDIGNLLSPAGVAQPVSGLAPVESAEAQALDAYMEGNVKTLQDLGGLFAGIEYLRYLDGEKHLVYVTEFGLAMPSGDYDVSLANIAADARVVVDVIHTGGITSSFDRRGLPRVNWAHAFSLEGLKTLAERTGGRAALFKWGHEALADIDRTASSQYVLGYYPRNGNQDGRFRRITVKVNRPGARIFYRHGYFARTQLVPLDRRQFMAHSRILAAGNYAGQIGDIGVKVDASWKRDRKEVEVKLSIAPRKLKVVERDGVSMIELDVAVFSGDGRQRPTGEVWQRIDLKLTPDQLAGALKQDIKYTLTFSPDRVPAHVKAVVYDHAGDLIGSATSLVR